IANKGRKSHCPQKQKTIEKTSTQDKRVSSVFQALPSSFSLSLPPIFNLSLSRSLSHCLSIYLSIYLTSSLVIPSVVYQGLHRSGSAGLVHPSNTYLFSPCSPLLISFSFITP